MRFLYLSAYAITHTFSAASRYLRKATVTLPAPVPLLSCQNFEYNAAYYDPQENYEYHWSLRSLCMAIEVIYTSIKTFMQILPTQS